MIELLPIFMVQWYCSVLRRALTVSDKEMCSIIKEHLDELGRMVEEGKVSGRAVALLLLCSFISCIMAGEPIEPRGGERLETDKGS